MSEREKEIRRTSGIVRVCRICLKEEGAKASQPVLRHKHQYMDAIKAVLARRRTINGLMEIDNSISLDKVYYLHLRSLRKFNAMHMPTGTVWSLMTAAPIGGPGEELPEVFPVALLDFQGDGYEYLKPFDDANADLWYDYQPTQCANTLCPHWTEELETSCRLEDIGGNKAITVCPYFMTLWSNTPKVVERIKP